MTDEPYNAAERSHVKAAQKAARFADRERGDIVKGLMSTVSGRAWTHNLLERCHVFASSFSENPIRMAFAEGERNIGLQLLSDLMTFTPDTYVLMMREKNERDASTSTTRNAPAEPDSVSEFIE